MGVILGILAFVIALAITWYLFSFCLGLVLKSIYQIFTLFFKILGYIIKNIFKFWYIIIPIILILTMLNLIQH